jgi:hypothetical protein
MTHAPVYRPLTEAERRHHAYLDRVNRAPYALILGLGVLSVLFFSALILVGTF